MGRYSMATLWLATISNGTITPTGNVVSQPINNNGTYLGTIAYSPTVSNGTLSLAYQSFSPTAVQIGGQTSYTAFTSYNPATGQVSAGPSSAQVKQLNTYGLAAPQTTPQAITGYAGSLGLGAPLVGTGLYNKVLALGLQSGQIGTTSSYSVLGVAGNAPQTSIGPPTRMISLAPTYPITLMGTGYGTAPNGTGTGAASSIFGVSTKLKQQLSTKSLDIASAVSTPTALQTKTGISLSQPTAASRDMTASLNLFNIPKAKNITVSGQVTSFSNPASITQYGISGQPYVPIINAKQYGTTPLDAFRTDLDIFLARAVAGSQRPGSVTYATNTGVASGSAFVQNATKGTLLYPIASFGGNAAQSFTSSILSIPFSYTIITNPGGTAKGLVSTAKGIGAQALTNPAGAAGQVFGIGASIYVGGKATEGLFSTTKGTDIEVNPTGSSIAYKSNPTGTASVIGTATGQTSLDALKAMGAEPRIYTPGLTTSGGLISTDSYQVSVAGGKIAYSINPSAADQLGAYEGASYSLASRLYGRTPIGTPALTGSSLVYGTTSGSVSDIGMVGRTVGDIVVPKGVKSIYGINVKSIQGVKYTFTGTTTGATSDIATMTGEGSASYTASLVVKNSALRSFITGASSREVVIGTGQAPIPSGYITPGPTGFTGRLLATDQGYALLESDSAGSFYGRNPTKTELGTQFSGYQLTTKGQAIPTAYYEATNLGKAAKAFNIDIGPEPAYSSSARTPVAKPPGSIYGTPTAIAAPASTQSILGSLETETATAKPPSPSLPSTFSVQAQSTSASAAIYGSAAVAPAALLSSRLASSNSGLVSGIGIDPVLILSQPSRQSQTRGLGNVGVNSVATLSIGRTATSQSNTVAQLMGSSTLSKVVSGQRTTTRNPLVNSNITALLNPSTQIRSTAQTQRQTQKQTQKQIYPSNGLPTVMPPAFAPGGDFLTRIAPSRKHGVKGFSPSPILQPHRFGYVSDVSSSLLGIRGKKGTKAARKAVGLFRPLY